MTTAYVIFQDGTRVHSVVADTEETRALGLMFRESLAEDEGMLFTFDEPRCYGFWMKNVRVPLDIIWVDEQGRVVWIVESAPPCDTDPTFALRATAGKPCPIYVPAAKASFVVEVAGGFAQRHGVAVGDTVTITRLR